MSEQNFNTFNDNHSDAIDLSQFLRYILMQSKMIGLITLTAFILASALYLTSTKIYKISSLLEVESFDKNSLDPTKTMMSPLKSSADLGNLIKLYKSRTNILQMIGDLNLNVQINDLSDKESVNIKFLQNSNVDIPYKEIFYILPGNKSFKIFSDEDGENLLIEANYDQEINIFNDFAFIIKSVNLDSKRLIKVNYQNPVLLYPRFRNSIILNANIPRNSFIRSEGLIEIQFMTHDIEEGKNIIDYANQIFINQRIVAETQKSRAAIDFIDENLIGLKKIVSQNKDKLKSFRETNQSIDLNLETQVIIDTIKSIDESLYKIEVDLADASKIYTDNNPVYNNLISKRKILLGQKDDILLKVKALPKEQQQYIDLFNQVDITQNLLAELESRRLGFSILEASTIGDIRVVDHAYLDSKVSPNIMSVILITFLALIFSLILALIRGINFLPVSNPAEIMDSGIFEPILGVIPFDETIDSVDLHSDGSRYKSAMEAAIVNIKSLQDEYDDEAKIISFTSPTPLNGKSTTSKNLAETLSLLDKKVLLVDADFKRGGLGKDFNIKSISENTFFNINSSNLDNFRISNNFYLIPRVKGLINSFHFICNPRYPKIFEDLKKDFDYIIFDTAPLLSVADTSIILKLADINLLVLRHEITKIREIKQTLDMFAQINTPVRGLIYNAYSRPSGYYGYYRLYKNYSYAYYSEKYIDNSYDYEKEI